MSSSQNVVYSSTDIDEQFYLHSQTGSVMVNTHTLVVGSYNFTVNATGGELDSVLSTIVFVRVSPEFYFANTEQDGSYLGYVSTDAPVGTQLTKIMPQFTLLNDTVFNCSIEGESSFFIGTSSRVTFIHSSTTGLEQFIVMCSAIAPSLVIIETLPVSITMVIYQISGILKGCIYN